VVVAAFLLSRQKDVQTPFRLLVGRAHGVDDLCLRHGWCAGYFRRIAAHDGTFAYQVGDLFTVGHAAQKSGTQVMDNIRGLIDSNPTIGWG